MLNWPQYVSIAFLLSLLGCGLIVYIARFRILLIVDQARSIQKIHTIPTPRIGGMALYAGLLGTCVVQRLILDVSIPYLEVLLLTGFPIFFAGFLEDISGRVSPAVRLFIALASALFFIVITDVRIQTLPLPLLDSLIEHSYLVSVLFTIFAIAGATHAFNMIDGFNGLCSGVAIITLGALLILSISVGDEEIAYISALVISAILGFLLFNYPLGKLFLGDSGAYLIGFILAVLVITLSNRNPQFSKWFAILIMGYPILDSIYSIVRRLAFGNMGVTSADNRHLHHLIYYYISGRLSGPSVNTDSSLSAQIAHRLVSPLIWGFSILSALLAVILVGSPTLLKICLAVIVLFYTLVYVSLDRNIHRRRT